MTLLLLFSSHNNDVSVKGVQCAAQVASMSVESSGSLTGVSALAECGTFEEALSPNILLVGVQAKAEFSGFERSIRLIGVSATAEVGTFPASTFPGPRTFFIAGVAPQPIPPGIVMLPTSDTVPMTTAGGVSYAVGSSQFYTVGQVSWSNELKTQGVDYQFVSPFSHIIRILDPSTVSGDITLVYNRWNIGVRAGFKVNSYPVPFSFTGTSIRAERPPPPDRYFTVQFTTTRPGTNPQTLFSLSPLMVDDMLADHTVYDGAKGFQTRRPECYQVLDTTLMQIFEWTGSAWIAIQDVASGTSFYVKTLRAIYENQGGVAVRKYTAGDGPNSSYPQAITYPVFGEGIGKNLIADGFSQNARTQYPAAYQVCSTPGTYASVCRDQAFDYHFDFTFD